MREPLIRRRVLVQGQVQGVFFRDSVRAQAHSRAAAGWIANRHDGAVEAVFEGPPEAVDALVHFCREGPPRAHVHEVQVKEERPEGLDGFDVL